MANWVINTVQLDGTDEQLKTFIETCFTRKNGKLDIDFNKITPVSQSEIDQTSDPSKLYREKWGCSFEPDYSFYDPTTKTLTMLTPWNPPLPILKAICKKIKGLSLDMYYYEPSMGFDGTVSAHYKDNELFYSHNSPSASKSYNEYKLKEIIFSLSHFPLAFYKDITNISDPHKLLSLKTDLIYHAQKIYEKKPSQFPQKFNNWNSLFINYLVSSKNPDLIDNTCLLNKQTAQFFTASDLQKVFPNLLDKYTNTTEMTTELKALNLSQPIIDSLSKKHILQETMYRQTPNLAQKLHLSKEHEQILIKNLNTYIKNHATGTDFNETWHDFIVTNKEKFPFLSNNPHCFDSLASCHKTLNTFRQLYQNDYNQFAHDVLTGKDTKQILSSIEKLSNDRTIALEFVNLWKSEPPNTIKELEKQMPHHPQKSASKDQIKSLDDYLQKITAAFKNNKESLVSGPNAVYNTKRTQSSFARDTGFKLKDLPLNQEEKQKALTSLYPFYKKIFTSNALLTQKEWNTEIQKSFSDTPRKTSKPEDNYTKTIADFFIKAINEGTAPWMKPWKAAEFIKPNNPVTKIQYSGTNSMYLEMYQQTILNSSDPRWMTFLNIRDNGYHLKKGSHGLPLCYYNKIMLDENGKKTTDEKEAKSYKSIRNYFIVFHASQIDGLPPLEKTANDFKDERVIETAQKVLDKSNAKIFHDSNNSNYYLPVKDEIHLTPKHTFDKIEDYYSTAFHELSHWTAHPSRLNRPINNTFGTPEYLAEELRAEIGSFLISKELNIDFNPKAASSYVAHWANRLQTDNKEHEILKACQDAEKIQNFCMKPVRERVKEQTQTTALETQKRNHSHGH